MLSGWPVAAAAAARAAQAAKAATATSAGAGGGGAGGTLWLLGSVVSGTITADCAGGAGGGNGGISGAKTGEAGANGFFTLSKNAGSLSATVSNATSGTTAGPQAPNLLVNATPNTPYLPDLLYGAAVAGLANQTPSAFPNVLNNAPQGAIAAVYRVHTHTAFPDDFAGFDYLILINLLTTNALPSPQMGFGASFVSPLTTLGQPFHANTSGTLDQLGASGVYVTLAPSSVSGAINFKLPGWTSPVSKASLVNGEVFYIVGSVKDYYVDIATGNDANPGTAAQPFKTVTRALSVASAGDNINVKQGNYGTDKPRITRFVHIKNWTSTGLARIGKP
jgi:hypothetical protein